LLARDNGALRYNLYNLIGTFSKPLCNPRRRIRDRRFSIRIHSLGNRPTVREEAKRAARVRGRQELIAWVNNGLGIEGRMEPGRNNPEEQGFETWVWEQIDMKGALLKGIRTGGSASMDIELVVGGGQD